MRNSEIMFQSLVKFLAKSRRSIIFDLKKIELLFIVWVASSILRFIGLNISISNLVCSKIFQATCFFFVSSKKTFVFNKSAWLLCFVSIAAVYYLFMLSLI